jgi:hypothetical protein
MSIRYKYQYFIEDFRNCPPNDWGAKNIDAFRFVFENLDDHRNFIPNSARNPTRDNSPKYKDDSYGKCCGYALSFYDSLENAKKGYQAYKKSFPKFDRIAGTHIAKGQIRENDGVTSRVNESGHFDLHEFENTDFRLRFNIVSRA